MDKERKEKFEYDAEGKIVNKDANPDPITGEHGSHPIGTGIGAGSAGAAGAAIGGGIGGPVGAVVGAAVGAVAGGLAGKGVAELVNPTEEEAYWREEYINRPYVTQEYPYEDYLPAYRYGWESYQRYPERRYEDIEPELEKGWTDYRGDKSNLEWEKVKDASRDAWNRVSEKARNIGRDDKNPKNC